MECKVEGCNIIKQCAKKGTVQGIIRKLKNMIEIIRNLIKKHTNFLIKTIVKGIM